TALIFVGLFSELLINKLITLSRVFGWGHEFIGLSILSIGTSIPEISSHIAASIAILRGGNMREISDIVVSTNIGSNIIQITLILGLVGLFMYVSTTKKFLKRDYLFMLIGILSIFFMGLNKNISRLESLILIVAYLAYLIWIYLDDKRQGKREGREIIVKSKTYKAFLVMLILLLLGLLLLSASLLINMATLLVEETGISGTLLGALVIGIGTAIPELATAISSIRRHASGIGLGVLIGSNITNPLMALGIGGLISTYYINPSILRIDLPFWFFSSVLILIFLRRDYKIHRNEAICMLFLYFLFLGLKLLIGM
ncbi:sodium:calcium antiporter, partial [Candidatus Woesearchaeota archaeon]|nr:sodium:calcium antiporter [Candidatus Woesearchaeota archaeon]